MARNGQERAVRHVMFGALTGETRGVGTRMIRPRTLGTCCGLAWITIACVSAGESAAEKPRSFGVAITALHELVVVAETPTVLNHRRNQ